MKCIIKSASIVLKPGVIERVSDERAASLVKAGLAAYTSKSLWKKQSREVLE